MTMRLLTLDQTAEAMGIPSLTLRTWVAKGYGPGSAKIGKRRMFRPADVEAWIDNEFSTQAGA